MKRLLVFGAVIAVLAGETRDFLPRISRVQWALMLAVYCLSHVPAVLILDIPGAPAGGFGLLARDVQVNPVVVDLGDRAARDRDVMLEQKPGSDDEAGKLSAFVEPHVVHGADHLAIGTVDIGSVLEHHVELDRPGRHRNNPGRRHRCCPGHGLGGAHPRRLVMARGS